jgi:hypothetical protein
MPLLMRARARAFAVLFAVAATTGCTRWTVVRGPVAERAANFRGMLRVEARSGAVLLVKEPQVLGDSIVGTDGRPGQSSRVAVAMSDVENLEYRGLDGDVVGGALLALLVGTALGLVFFAVVVMLG